MSDAGAAEALAALDAITRRLRVECPWDREQDERSIVPHTVEEDYELADAARAGDDAKLLDELGDVLFQVFFLSLLLEERGEGDLGRVAESVRQKLIRRHPHVFGEVEVNDAGDVRRNWDAIKLDEPGRRPGLFGEVPETLPGPLYAAKVLKRAEGRGSVPSIAEATAALSSAETSDERTDAVGTLLLAAVAEARALGVDPELSLRSAADRFRQRVEQEDGSTSE